MRLTALTTMIAISGLTLGTLYAGTLMLKDGSTVSDIEIVSIEDGKVTIEKDKTSRTIGLGSIKGYYRTDIKGTGDFVTGLADYTVKISKVEMPDYGGKKPSGGNKKIGSSSSGSNAGAECEINYRITRRGENAQLPRVRAPYFYLYVLLSGDEQYGNRVVRFFCHPKEAKPKGGSNKAYERAAILAILGNFDRPLVYFNNLPNSFADQKITIPLRSLPHRKIIAYHIEVYGNTDLILEENWRDLGSSVDPKHQWWRDL